MAEHGGLDLAPILDARSPGAQLLVKGSNRFFWQARTVDRLRDALEDCHTFMSIASVQDP